MYFKSTFLIRLFSVQNLVNDQLHFLELNFHLKLIRIDTYFLSFENKFPKRVSKDCLQAQDPIFFCFYNNLNC
jgi:hypothetical protein